LVRGQRPSELLALERVVASGLQAELSFSQRAPGYTEAGTIEAAEGSLQSLDVREEVGFRHEDLIHHDFAGD